jgi:co-chaperonin GroES (HSP10)
MNFQPLNDKILVELLPDLEKEQKEGDLYVAGKESSFHRGKVLGVGVGYFSNGEKIPIIVKEGDTIIFPKNTGFPVERNSSGNPTKMIIDRMAMHARII